MELQFEDNPPSARTAPAETEGTVEQPSQAEARERLQGGRARLKTQFAGDNLRGLVRRRIEYVPIGGGSAAQGTGGSGSGLLRVLSGRSIASTV